MARALFADWIQRYQKFSEALIAWHESFNPETERFARRPPRIMDITAAQYQLQTIAKLAQQLEESRLKDALSQGEMIEILQEVSVATEDSVALCPHCHGSLAPVLEAIKQRWASIQLWGRRAKGTHGQP